MPSLFSARSLVALCLTFGACFTHAADDQFWEYKDWKVFGERDAKGGKRCKAMSGGDGDDMFYVAARPGGDISIYFQEQTYRGMKPSLKKTDKISFLLDDKKQSRYDDVQVFVDVDEEGIPRAIAGLPGGYSAEMVGAMRAASSVTVLLEDAKTRKPVVLHKFSLAGFAANFLKAAEWCNFNPNKIKVP